MDHDFLTSIHVTNSSTSLAEMHINLSRRVSPEVGHIYFLLHIQDDWKGCSPSLALILARARASCSFSRLRYSTFRLSSFILFSRSAACISLPARMRSFSRSLEISASSLCSQAQWTHSQCVHRSACRADHQRSKCTSSLRRVQSTKSGVARMPSAHEQLVPWPCRIEANVQDSKQSLHGLT